MPLLPSRPSVSARKCLLRGFYSCLPSPALGPSGSTVWSTCSQQQATACGYSKRAWRWRGYRTLKRVGAIRADPISLGTRWRLGVDLWRSGSWISPRTDLMGRGHRVALNAPHSQPRRTPLRYTDIRRQHCLPVRTRRPWKWPSWMRHYCRRIPKTALRFQRGGSRRCCCGSVGLDDRSLAVKVPFIRARIPLGTLTPKENCCRTNRPWDNAFSGHQ
jgi:hypothetical protein